MNSFLKIKLIVVAVMINVNISKVSSCSVQIKSIFTISCLNKIALHIDHSVYIKSNYLACYAKKKKDWNVNAIICILYLISKLLVSFNNLSSHCVNY